MVLSRARESRLQDSSNKIRNGGRHFFDLGVVELLQLAKGSDIFFGHEVDGNTLSSETTGTTNTMDVILEILGKIIVDDKGNLLHVDTTGQEISGDQDSARARSEFGEDNVSLLLADISVGRRNSKFTGAHFVGEFVDLPSGVAEDDGLCDVQGIVQIAEGVELPVFLLDGDIELLDTFEGQLVALHQDGGGGVHEFLGDFQGLGGHGGREQSDLGVRGEGGEDVIDLVFETTGEHFVGLVEDEDLDLLGAQEASAEHVIDTPGGSDDDMGSLLKLGDVLANVGSSDARMASDSHVFSE